MRKSSDEIAIDQLESGDVLSKRYKIIEEIGTGGMSNVYRAIDMQESDHELALKVLHKEFIDDKSYVERFIREVHLLHEIEHPNVVHTYDIYANDGIIFFTMEYVKGNSLRDLMDTRTLTPGEIAHLTIQICKGLQAVHSKEIIHRDLKPGNLLIDENGLLKIVDFGVARPKASRLTTENQKVGSVSYMAPEIWLGEELTPAVDYYSLGILLYEMCTGDVPFDDPFPGKVMHMHLQERVPIPLEINPEVPKWLSDLILRLLSKDKESRIQNAQEIINLLRSHVTNLSFSSDKLPAIDKNTTPSRTRNKTYIFSLRATKIMEDSKGGITTSKPRKKGTVKIPLPRNAAFIFEIEIPSRDFIFFGIFLGSLQIFDGFLTSLGMNKFGLHAEGNPFLRSIFYKFGPENTMLVVKSLAIIAVIFLTVLAKKIRWIKDLIGALSCIYLFAAILPWIYFIFIKYK